jgi:fructuronate reductase
MTTPILKRLNDASLSDVRPPAVVPAYARGATKIGIVHIGPGAFHRAHQASYVDSLLQSDPRWAISALSLKSAGVRDALVPQDGLYTLCELGAEPRLRVIGAIREVLVATQQRDAAFARLTHADTRMVTLTVTEKGYCLDAHGALDAAHPDIVHDWQVPQDPQSIFGWLCEALRRRRTARLAPFTVVSCDNLADNGKLLHAALVAFAAHSDRDLAQWIGGEVVFPRTMVDSITPATDDALREKVAARLGVSDAWPVQREPFTQWVIEDLPAMHSADWKSVGVTLAADVSAYERAKLRLLNGAHSTLAYVGLLLCHETVNDAMNDAALSRFVERMMRDDIAPLAGNGIDVGPYIDAVLARFANPGVRHLLSQIAWDGSKKLPVRILGTVSDALAGGKSIDRLLIPIAAWMRFVARQAHAGVAIVDPEAAKLAGIGSACTGTASHDIPLFMAGGLFPPALAQNPAFLDALRRAYDEMQQPLAALASRMKQHG